MPDKEYAVIVAGGIGMRMKSTVPKQYLPLNGLPVMMHAIKAFYEYSQTVNIIVVIPEHDFNSWEKLCRQYHFQIPVKLAPGGKTRFQSVKNGLKLTGDKGIVAIHDGVRPLLNKKMISDSFQMAALHGSAVASVRLKESIMIIDKDRSKSMDRSKYRLIQTPQTFQIPIIKEAYRQPERNYFTDDASVAEKYGCKISLFEGSYKNIKITTPDDLLLAELFLKRDLS